MYLPSFYKYRFDKYAFNAKRAMPFALPALIWGINKWYIVAWVGFPYFYNTLYTDFIPPARGVERR